MLVVIFLTPLVPDIDISISPVQTLIMYRNKRYLVSMQVPCLLMLCLLPDGSSQHHHDTITGKASKS